jgi:cytochrome c oxidase subunit III
MVEALAAIRQGDQRGLRKFLLLTVLGGVAFLGLQAYEWNKLIFHEGQSITRNNFGATFFILTGFHGCHVFSGVVYLSVVLARALSGAFSAHSNNGVEIVALYWHFVDLIWILVFTFVYLL